MIALDSLPARAICQQLVSKRALKSFAQSLLLAGSLDDGSPISHELQLADGRLAPERCFGSSSFGANICCLPALAAISELADA